MDGSADSLADGVTICVCTFRRPALFDALASFEKLLGIADHNLSVVVIDNDETDAVRANVLEMAKNYSLPLRYVHAPAKNISIARNAALDAVDTRYLLFIDDDEVAAPDWLQQIMACAQSHEVVIGQCIATYDPSLPAWAENCDFHSNRITGKVENAYTGNALLDMEFVRQHGFRFRIELGRTGGEDTVFFRQIAGANGRIHYCPDAIVFEAVPQGRASMEWVKTRMYRAGQTHGLITREFDPKSYQRLFFTACTKAVFSSLMTMATIPGSDASKKWWARAHLHAGAMHYRIKPEILEEYG